jgi:hypothetical protein
MFPICLNEDPALLIDVLRRFKLPLVGLFELRRRRENRRGVDFIVEEDHWTT